MCYETVIYHEQIVSWDWDSQGPRYTYLSIVGRIVEVSVGSLVELISAVVFLFMLGIEYGSGSLFLGWSMCWIVDWWVVVGEYDDFVVQSMSQWCYWTVELFGIGLVRDLERLEAVVTRRSWGFHLRFRVYEVCNNGNFKTNFSFHKNVFPSKIRHKDPMYDVIIQII